MSFGAHVIFHLIEYPANADGPVCGPDLYEIPISLRFYPSGIPTRSGARYCPTNPWELLACVAASQSGVSLLDDWWFL
jgi:hypothetical protein